MYSSDLQVYGRREPLISWVLLFYMEVIIRLVKGVYPICTCNSASCFPTSPMSDPTSLRLLTDVSPSLSMASSQSANERPKYFKDASLILSQQLRFYYKWNGGVSLNSVYTRSRFKLEKRSRDLSIQYLVWAYIQRNHSTSQVAFLGFKRNVTQIMLDFMSNVLVWVKNTQSINKLKCYVY